MENLSSETPILVVDDSMMARQYLLTILQDLGFKNLSIAPDGKAALDKIAQEKIAGRTFKVIFLDWNMPEMDGYAFLQKYQEDESWQEAAIVMVTSVSEKRDVITALEQGVRLYITKPYEAEEVAKKIKQLDEWMSRHAAH